MAMRIQGLGQGPLADRSLLGERHKRNRDPQEHPQRQARDEVHRQFGPSEQARAEFAALHSAIRQSEDALAMATLAEEGLGQVAAHLQTLVAHLRPLAGAGEAPADAAAQPQAPPEEDGRPPWLTEALAAIERIAERAQFGHLRLLDGSLGCSGVALGDGLEFVGAGLRTRSSPPQGYEVLLSEEPVRATLLGERRLSATTIAEGVALELSEGGRTVRLRTRAGQTPQQVAAALQAAAQGAGLALLVEATGDGRLLVQHQLFGAAHRFAAFSSLPGVLSPPQGGPAQVGNGRDIAGVLHGEPALGDGQTLAGCGDQTATAGLVVRYTGLPYTGRTQQLPRSRPALLEPRVFAGRVVVAQQALCLRLGAGPEDVVSLCLDSVHCEHLARGVATASGFASLGEIRAGTLAEARDALRLAEHAREELARRRESLRILVRGRLVGVLARLRVQAQNLAAAATEPLGPRAALHAVQALSQRIVREGRSALTAQAHPPQGTLLGLLGGEATEPRDPRLD